MNAAPKLATLERRAANRVGLGNVIAHVDLHDGNQPMMICVWDMSLSGACLLVPPDVPIPERITLIFDHAVRDARVVWRTWTHVGVCFAEPL
jgi:hypothetical protein